ncbi:unnamed protein product, partial [Musa textilis]
GASRTFFCLSCKKWWNEQDAGSRDQFFPKAKAAYAILRGGTEGELRLGFVYVKDLAREGAGRRCKARRSEKLFIWESLQKKWLQRQFLLRLQQRHGSRNLPQVLDTTT